MCYDYALHKQAANLEKIVQTPNKNGYLCLDVIKLSHERKYLMFETFRSKVSPFPEGKDLG